MKNKTILHRVPVVLFTITFGIFIILFIRYQRKPEIIKLDRLIATPGEKLEITGRYFGDGIEGSSLYIGSSPLTSTGIVEWSDTRILARVPRNDGTVLVKVKTRSGVSRGVVLGDASRFPRINYGSWLPGAPFTEYIDPPSGGPGTLVTLHGDGFGDRQGNGQIWVNHSDPLTLLGTEKPKLSYYVQAEAIKLWSEKTIQFWLPQGSSSGNIYVFKDDLFSNPVSVEINKDAGSLMYGKNILWSIRQDVRIDRIGAFPGNSLYLRIPSPQMGTGQGRAVILEPPGKKSLHPVRTDGNLSLYRIKELSPGDTPVISRQIVVSVKPVQGEIHPEGIVAFDPALPALASALESDAWISPDLVSRISRRVLGRTKGIWKKTRILYDYVMELLSWNDSPASRIISDYISLKTADSEGYSFLFVSLARAAGIPARPVGGILIDNDGHTRSWWWAEIWIEGVGWLPVDPALGDNADIFLLEGADGDPEDYYFGNLEGRHIAFSRGILPEKPLQPNSGFHIPEERYSLQNVWEEVSGNLESYKSSWIVPRITATY